MKKGIVLLAAALSCGIAGADELSDGIKAWEQQDYVQAHRIFDRLANAGNTEAQRQLGEMIGFGEGVPENLGVARSWLERARAAGNKDAAESLALVERRASHKADIQRYLSAFDGAGLALASYGCAQPAIPESSGTKPGIVAVHGQIDAFYECYGRFVKGLQAALPPQTASLMNTAELAQAQAHMRGTLTRLAAEGRAQADAVALAEGRWVAATEKRVTAYDTIARQMTDLEKAHVFQNLAMRESKGSLATPAPAPAQVAK